MKNVHCSKNLTGLVLILLLVGFCTLPSIFTSPASARDSLKVGLLEEPKTLNIWMASDTWSSKVLSQIYQPLYIREPEKLDLIPWLAESDPLYNAADLSYTVTLRPAKWSDGTEVTAEDVIFTGEFIQEFKIPRYASYFKFVKKIEALDQKTVRYHLEKPQAIFLSRTLTTPIVQKRQWMPIVNDIRGKDKPLAEIINVKIDQPIGCGPFVLKEWQQGAYIFMAANPDFFGRSLTIAGHKLGPYIDGIIFKVFGTSDAAILALKKGTIDMFWWGIQAGYIEDLKKQKTVEIHTNDKSALYYLGFNVRKAPFSDPALRRAIATLIDKDFIITRILQGYAIELDSVVPPGNRFWHCPNVPSYGKGLPRNERIKAAYDILKNAGYSWDTPPVDPKGKISAAKGLRLPDGKTMEGFTILTPPADYDPNRAMTGMIVQEWLRQMGMPATSRPMAFGALIDQVKSRHDFDAFVLGYGKLSLDPDYIRNFFSSSNDKSKGSNMSGYRNPEFDRIAEESAATMDAKKRQDLIWTMQGIILEDVPYIPIYNPKVVEAVRNDHFKGWVDMIEGIGNHWSFCLVEPR
ncbi:ABC transporter substrate-binding protein [Desulfatiglans anilini]|uniref:ABC transporter substrate-binding protein n=1 Tax=Desulfatiglans anilini TaxID=90728 RepID=UPI00042A5613|nr:ABC transporter substrate-binding protein [Desulfatiglans anilini]